MEDILEAALDHALSLGAEYAEARYQRDRSWEYILKNGTPEVSSRTLRAGVSIRVTVKGHMAFVAANDDDPIDLAERAVRLAELSQRIPATVSRDDSAVSRAKDIVTAQIPITDLDREEVDSMLSEAEAAASDAVLRTDTKLVGSFMALSFMETEKVILNSDGGLLISSVPRAAFNAFLTVVNPNKGAIQRHISRGATAGWEAVLGWDVPTVLASEVETLGKILTEARSFKGATTDIVLGPEIIGLVAHESAGHPSEADRLLGREAAQAGETFRSEKGVPERIGKEILNVIDDPTLNGSFGYYRYDDECVRARPRNLICKGIFDELLHDRSSAAAMGLRSNGSSRSRFFCHEPIIRMSNTFVSPGDHSFEELIEDIKDGIYMRNFMEWNIDDRRYNQRYVGLECYKIRNGELEDMISSPTLEMSTPALWSAIDALGSDLQFSSALCGKGDPMQGVPVWTGGPHVRLRSVPMGGKV